MCSVVIWDEWDGAAVMGYIAIHQLPNYCIHNQHNYYNMLITMVIACLCI